MAINEFDKLNYIKSKFVLVFAILGKNRIIIIGCILFCISCSHLDKPSNNFKRLLNSNSTSTKKINFTGAFHNNTKHNYYLEEPIYFFKNGLVYYDYISLPDSTSAELQSNTYKKYLHEEKTWGVYEIIGDTLNASIYCAYYGSRTHILLTNFQGVIINSDTIVNWHMVEPFPELGKSLREKYLNMMTMNRTIYSKNISFKPYMDSASSKIWINKFRNK